MDTGKIVQLTEKAPTSESLRKVAVTPPAPTYNELLDALRDVSAFSVVQSTDAGHYRIDRDTIMKVHELVDRAGRAGA